MQWPGQLRGGFFRMTALTQELAFQEFLLDSIPGPAQREAACARRRSVVDSRVFASRIYVINVQLLRNSAPRTFTTEHVNDFLSACSQPAPLVLTLLVPGVTHV
jgi:hypothetical protein